MNLVPQTVRAFLARRAVFRLLVAGLILVSAANVYWFRHDFATLARVVFLRSDPEVARWQQWAQHYRRLFGMLKRGERIGVFREGYVSAGIVLERAPQGVVARRSLFVRGERPGVILTLAENAAEELLSSVPQTEPDAIWQMMKDRLYGRQITVWCDSDLDRLQQGGHLAFLRAIDTRPPYADWPAIKARLGEK